MSNKNKIILRTIIVSIVVGMSWILLRMEFFSKIDMSNIHISQGKEFDYYARDFGVSMLLPSTPTIDSEKVEKNGVPLVITTVLSIGADSSKYQIITTKYPIGTFDSLDVNDLLQIASSAVIEGTNFKLVRSVDTSINSFPSIITKAVDDQKIRSCIIIFNKNKTVMVVGDLHNSTQYANLLHYFSTLSMGHVSN
jgi:hypothetical protein